MSGDVCAWCGSDDRVYPFLAGPLCAEHHPPGAVLGPQVEPVARAVFSARDGALERRVRESAARARDRRLT